MCGVIIGANRDSVGTSVSLALGGEGRSLREICPPDLFAPITSRGCGTSNDSRHLSHDVVENTRRGRDKSLGKEEQRLE